MITSKDLKLELAGKIVLLSRLYFSKQTSLHALCSYDPLEAIKRSGQIVKGTFFFGWTDYMLDISILSLTNAMKGPLSLKPWLSLLMKAEH